MCEMIRSTIDDDLFGCFLCDLSQLCINRGEVGKNYACIVVAISGVGMCCVCAAVMVAR